MATESFRGMNINNTINCQKHSNYLKPAFLMISNSLFSVQMQWCLGLVWKRVSHCIFELQFRENPDFT